MDIFLMMLRSACSCAESSGCVFFFFFTSFLVPLQEMRTFNSCSTPSLLVFVYCNELFGTKP